MRAQFVNSENKTESHISFSIYIQILHTLGVAKHHLDMRLCDACQGINISFGFNAATAKKKRFVCCFLRKIQEKKSSIKSTTNSRFVPISAARFSNHPNKTRVLHNLLRGTQNK